MWTYAQGVAHYVAEEFTQAEAKFREAIEHGLEEFWAAWFSLAYILDAQGKRLEAIEALKSSVKYAPASSQEGFEKVVHNYFENRPHHAEALTTLRSLWPEAFPAVKQGT